MGIAGTDIAKKIIEFARSANPNGMVSYLKEQLEDGKTTAQDILDYASKYVFSSKPGEPHVINAEIINMLGVVVSELKDNEQSKLSVQFYKLAADRDSSWGNCNYAELLLYGNQKCGIQKSPKKALIHARKAVELAKDIKNEQHEHNLILCRALKENQQWNAENISLLLDYFEFKSNQLAAAKNTEVQKSRKKDIVSALKLLDIIITDFQKVFEDKKSLSEDFCKINLTLLEAILKCEITSNLTFERIRQDAYYFQGKFYEILNDYSKAMVAYCKIKDKESRFYIHAIDARAQLLKEQVKRELSSENSRLKNKPKTLTLPDGTQFPTKFGKKWVAEADWLHSVDEIKITEEFKKRDMQLDHLIAAKKTEIALVDEILEDIDNEEMNIQREKTLKKKEYLQQEMKHLEQTQNDLEKEYEMHLHNNRQIFRRHATESHFFNPGRSKKQEQLLALTCELIDLRFRHEKSAPSQPINLSGISTRLLITAEKAFQNAVIALTGKDNPILGIPTVKTKPWTVESYYGGYTSGETGFGPTETYQIGDTKIQSEHRTSPKRQRLGDSFLPRHGTYDRDIYPVLRKFTDEDIEKEKQLATLLIRYGRKHHPVTKDELQKLYPEAEDQDVDNFNSICFLIMEKEQSQWLSATDESFQLGMSVAQARCLIMMEAGFIRLKEALKNGALFGVYSHTGILSAPDKVASSCKYIDELYMLYLQHKHQQEHCAFFKKNIKDKSPRLCLTTRKQAHEDIRYVYGGDSDTDDEGYDSDLSM